MDKITLILTDNTVFHYGEEPDAWQAWYDDSGWEAVRLPHDWSVTYPFSREYSSGTGYLAGGVGWYRIRITPRTEWQGKRISVTFDGVYKNSRIWCNSYYLGERPNGYISFTYDITDQFRFDRENILCVRVDHRDISDSRWFSGSGITRKAALVVEEGVHPVPDGIFFTTPSVTAKEARIEVQNEIVNTLNTDVCVAVTNKLLDSRGGLAAEAEGELQLPPGESGIVCTMSRLDNPSLWSPERPALYTLQTWLRYTEADGLSVCTLAHSCRVGIRSFSFDPDKGFFLNGSPALLKGVCLHHDAGVLGAAVLPNVWRRRLIKLKSMGCNAVRMSHNPHMPELYELCDEMGFLAMDEAFDEWEGPKNKWWQGHNVYPPRHEGYYIDFPAWHRQDLTDLIRRDRNHPSIILWSIGNEIDYPNDPYCHASFATMTGNNDANKPAQERQFNPARPNAERLPILAKELAGIVKEADASRPVTLAAAFPELSAALGFLNPLDVAGYNYKEQLYAEHHARYPKTPFLGSENGHSLAAWRAVTDNPYISGQFLWTGIDYLGEAHGWPVHGSGAGLLTLAGFEKTGYYRRQSLWSDAPMLHLATFPLEQGESDDGLNHAGHREFAPYSECWNYPAGTTVLVKCYTNLPQVEVFLNEVSVGRFSRDDSDAGSDAISFTLPFTPGTLRAQGLWQDGSPVPGCDAAPLCHSLHTTGCACQINLNCWKEEASRGEEEQGGENKPAQNLNIFTDKESRLHQLEVTLLDGENRRVYTDSTLLHVTVEKGRLLGLENGNLADVTDYSAPFRTAFHGQLLVYVAQDTSERPIVHVSAPGSPHIAPATLICGEV